MRKTECSKSRDLERRDECDIVVGAGISAECKQDFQSCLDVTHLQGDGERAIDGELGAIRGLGQSATGELRHCALIEAAGGWVLEEEVCCGHWEGREGEEREFHDDGEFDERRFGRELLTGDIFIPMLPLDPATTRCQEVALIQAVFQGRFQVVDTDSILGLVSDIAAI